jgi:hypothetical protein
MVPIGTVVAGAHDARSAANKGNRIRKRNWRLTLLPPVQGRYQRQWPAGATSDRVFFFAFPASVPDGEVDERSLGNDEKEEPYQEDERKNAVHLFGKSAALAARLH